MTAMTGCFALLITGSCTLAHAAPLEFSKGLDIRADVGFMFDDNVTRAKESADKLADRSYSLNLSKPLIYPLADHARILFNGSVGGEKFIHYSGLSHIFGSVSGELQYRSYAEFTAPTFAVFARGFAEQYQSRLRDSSRFSVGVSMKQPVTDRIQIFGALTHNQRQANSAVFDTKDNAARLNLDYTATRSGTLYLTGEYRRGDVVSTGHPSLEFIDIAKVFVQDDAYPGGQFYSYRFDGTTVLTTLGYNIGFSSRRSLDLSWRRIKSTSARSPNYATSAASYVANQFSIVYLVNF
ncbi:MAG: hypothetical protein ABI536_01495 [Gallionella sp.]